MKIPYVFSCVNDDQIPAVFQRTSQKEFKQNLHTQTLYSFLRHKLDKKAIRWREWRRKSFVHHPQKISKQLRLFWAAYLEFEI